ncbi:MAG: DEAD/DEAH box helicase, partial [Sphaerochaetaceae bacterium]|nr:DEAD/DEAH box helicase [Sphaerochaetaceae bacterium]
MKKDTESFDTYELDSYEQTFGGEPLRSIIKCAQDYFSIKTLKPFQILVMERIMEQEDESYPICAIRDQIVILPTGLGKSIMFLVPSILCKGLTIIVYPILALINDQKRKLDKGGVASIILRGGQTKEQRQQCFEALKQGVKIVITTAESLSNTKVVRELSKYSISLFVIDEAHVVKQWGIGDNPFRPYYGNLGAIIKTLKPRQTLAFTATASESTVEELKSRLFVKKPLVVRGDGDRENIIYYSYVTPNKMEGVFQILKKCQKPAIVFCYSRKDTYSLCLSGLQAIKNVPMRYYHGGLEKQEREAVEQWFLETENGVFPFLSVKDLKEGYLDFENCLYTSQSNYEYLKRNLCNPKQGDVLISKDGTIGKTVTIDYDKMFVVASS